jgi:phosphoribosylamine--glycine ligase
MGDYAPVSIADASVVAEARSEIFAPTLRALAADGARFRGTLYAGLMVTTEGLKVVEFNCRFGDPETQAVLPLMTSSLLDLMATVAEGGSLRGRTASFRKGAAVTTVVAAGGYPGAYEKGREITVPSDLESDDLIVFHAGTTSDGGPLRTSGGRVAAVTAVGATFAGAAEASRDGAARIDFHGAFYRRDLGWRERARQEKA